MPSIRCAGLSVMLLAGVALGQPLATQLKYEVRAYNAANNTGWASSVNVNPGTRVEVRAVVSYVGTGNVAGLGQIVFQPVVSDWRPGLDVLGTNGALGLPGFADGIGPYGGIRSAPRGTVNDVAGSYGRITPWGANATNGTTYLRGHLGTGTATGLLRIAQANITNWIGTGATSGTGAANNVNGGGGVSVAQIPSPFRTTSDPAFVTATTNIVVFKFAFIPGAAPLSRSLSIDTPAAGFNRTLTAGQYVPNIRWFANASDSTASIQTAAFAVPAIVNVAPAPGAAALLGLGVVVAGRRRRV